MARNLVLFSDGTGNSAGKLFKTNVWRLYEAVDLTDPQDPKQPRQFACYDDGVGTSSFKPLAVLGGAFGVGLARNVVDLYVFLCRMYEPGDHIYAFGFSRGAFTIRILVGLVMTQGLLRYRGSEGELQRLAHDAYRRYRAVRFASRNPIVTGLRHLRNAWLDAWNSMLGRVPYSRAERIGQPTSPDPIQVDFLGVWDTVDAYGLPVDELTRAIDLAIWPLTMREYNPNPRVLRARHALAIDDERNSFHPRLWNEEPDPAVANSGVPGGNLATRHVDEERISQVWFAGVHSNVGGGYPDDSLSYVPLQWMMREADKYGLRFEKKIWDQQIALSDENGPIYDSRRGLGGYYRYNPRRIERLARMPGVTVGRSKIHESVLRRIQAGHDGYAPIALPAGFAVMKIDGSIVEGDEYLRGMSRTAVAAAAAPAAPPASASLVGATSSYGDRREHVYNWVWRRRVAYFVTLAVTLALALMPLFAPGTEACRNALCFLASPIAALGLLLPSFATAWTDSFSSHPELFLPLFVALIVGLRRGATLEQRVQDEMRRVWYAMPTLKPSSPTNVPAPTAPSALQRGIEGLRNHPAYRATFYALTHGVLPLGFLFVLAYGAVALYSQLAFATRSSAGDVCRASSAASGAAAATRGWFWFDPSSSCAPAGVRAVKGTTYRVRITVPAGWRWYDRTIAAGPNGFECQASAWLAAAVPLRRHLTQPWFQPMARIGETGNDTYPLQGSPHTAPAGDRCNQEPPAVIPPRGCPDVVPPPGPADQVFESLFVARSSGELFVYVNDAVDIPLADGFYANNRGCARIDVSPVVPPR